MFSSSKDVLRSRTKTSGVVELCFEYRSVLFFMYDVGGQQSERRKWIHLFSDVNGVIFVSALSEYDQVFRCFMLLKKMFFIPRRNNLTCFCFLQKNLLFGLVVFYSSLQVFTHWLHFFMRNSTKRVICYLLLMKLIVVNR